MATTVRRKARTVALQVLYELDSTNHDARQTMQRALEESGLPDDGRAFATEIIEGVLRSREKIDSIIQKHAPAWPVEQLSVVDRNILRVAIYEILMNNKTPPRAAINEAVEISKTFGGENIHRFINGVLGAVVADANA